MITPSRTFATETFPSRRRSLSIPVRRCPIAAVGAVLGHFSALSPRFAAQGVRRSPDRFRACSPRARPRTYRLCAGRRTSRRISLASICAAASLPIALALLGNRGPELFAAIAVAALVAFTHRANVQRLLAGTEAPFEVKSDR